MLNHDTKYGLYGFNHDYHYTCEITYMKFKHTKHQDLDCYYKIILKKLLNDKLTTPLKLDLGMILTKNLQGLSYIS